MVTRGRTRGGPTLFSRDRACRSQESQLLDAADRLFAEFDDLPTLLVFQTISSTRRALRSLGVSDPTPQQIESGAREHLRKLHDDLQ